MQVLEIEVGLKTEIKEGSGTNRLQRNSPREGPTIQLSLKHKTMLACNWCCPAEQVLRIGNSLVLPCKAVIGKRHTSRTKKSRRSKGTIRFQRPTRDRQPHVLLGRDQNCDAESKIVMLSPRIVMPKLYKAAMSELDFTQIHDAHATHRKSAGNKTDSRSSNIWK